MKRWDKINAVSITFITVMMMAQICVFYWADRKKDDLLKECRATASDAIDGWRSCSSERIELQYTLLKIRRDFGYDGEER